MKYHLMFAVLMLVIGNVEGQTSATGVKGGLSVGLQSWNGQEREPLLAYNAGLVYEKFNSSQFSYLLDFGYHQRGSAIRQQFYDLQGNLIRLSRTNRFHNLSLMAGAKSVLNTSFSGGDVYYLLGVRVEYTMADSIGTAANMSRFVRPINYGVTAGGGIQFSISDRALLFFEVQVSPDFSQQVYAPPGNYFTNFNGNTVLVQLNEQRVVNTSIELTIGFKFLKYSPIY